MDHFNIKGRHGTRDQPAITVARNQRLGPAPGGRRIFTGDQPPPLRGKR